MISFSDAVLSREERLSRWGFLGLATAPLVGSVLFNHGMAPPFVICPVRSLTSIPCPGCGLTRSFMAIARGDFDDALSMHLFGPVLFAAFLLVVVLMAAELKTGRRLQRTPFRYLQRVQNWWWLALLYFGYYGVRLTSLIQTGEFYINPFSMVR
ncbi:DUF2752 domain-containing protein [Parathermosynechococcus lividus]